MKRMLFAGLLCLLLCGCGPKPASMDENGVAWSEDCVTIGTRIGVLLAEKDPKLLEYNDVQGLDGIYYTSFSWGEGRKILNDDGKEADLYPAQLFLLTQECPDDGKAEVSLAAWKTVGENSYTLEELEPDGFYRFYSLTPEKDSPYAGGILALGVHNGIAISAELLCTGEYFDNPRETAAEFLSGLHFRAWEG